MSFKQFGKMDHFMLGVCICKHKVAILFCFDTECKERLFSLSLSLFVKNKSPINDPKWSEISFVYPTQHSELFSVKANLINSFGSNHLSKCGPNIPPANSSILLKNNN